MRRARSKARFHASMAATEANTATSTRYGDDQINTVPPRF
jgi:hypothetical protein